MSLFRFIPHLLVFLLIIQPAYTQLSFLPCNATPPARASLISHLESMFDHAFNSYLDYAYPSDELLPLSCGPTNNFGNLSVTLLDTLDTLFLLKRFSSFVSHVKYLEDHLSFDQDVVVSVFETTIRVLGSLLSAHGFLVEPVPEIGFNSTEWYPSYNNHLLNLAVDLADRLMPAFDTATSIPFGAINLRYGVMRQESRVASTAGAGSLLLEFGTLSRYTGDPRYYQSAFAAMNALHSRASALGLVGNHINIDTGRWVATEAGVGGLSDSFYEYMLKGYVLFGDKRLLTMFRQSYKAIRTHLYKRPWYLDAEMTSGVTSSLRYSSLAAFWPGVQTLVGDTQAAIETTRAHYAVWRKYGCLPEGYHVLNEIPFPGQINYPLRPELVESVFYLHWATGDDVWINVANAMMHSIDSIAKVKCGYAAIRNTATHELEDVMPSFLLSETFKYLYLVFAANDENGHQHWIRSGQYVFNTEAHPLRIYGDEIRKILGDHFDEIGVEEGDNNGEVEHGRWRTPRCRRRKGKRTGSCGNDVPGSDWPLFNKAEVVRTERGQQLTPEMLQMISKELERRAENGEERPGVGDVLFADTWASRAVKIEGDSIIFQRLNEAEMNEMLKGEAIGELMDSLTKTIRGEVEGNCARSSGRELVGVEGFCALEK